MTTGPEHLGVLAEESFTRFGDHPTLWFDGRWSTSLELHERACRVAAGLVGLGLAPGDRVVVCMRNGPEVPVAYAAVWRAGGVVTPVVFVLTGPELRHVLADSGAVAVLTSADFAAKVSEAAAGLPGVRHVVVAGGPAPAGTVAWADLESAGPLAAVVDRAADDLAALMYTGGTTGRSKGVMLSHRAVSAAGRAGLEATYQPGLSRTLMCLPLAHAYGMLVTVSGMFSPEPRSTIVMRWFDPAEWLALAVEHRVPYSPLVPSMLQMLLAAPLESHDLSALRLIGCGAAPLAREVLEEFERRVPGAVVGEGYGCTETAGIISVNPLDRRRVGSVGLPVPGWQVRVVSGDGAELPAGADGEIVVRAPGVMTGYWQAPEDNAQALRDGWFHTGDIGHLDGDGYLYVVDRIKDLIIRGGFNVYPRDVEDVLLAHPAVAAAAVVGRPDERYGEEVVAFVALGSAVGAVTAEGLLAWCAERLAGTKRPREVHLLDAIPLTSVGKTDRKALRATLRD